MDYEKELRQDYLSVKELASYYVTKYHLHVIEEDDNKYGNYITQLTRIMKSTRISGESMWIKIKPKKGSRKLTIDYFEAYCFTKWCDYIERNLDEKNYDKVALERDKESYFRKKEEENYSQKANETIDKTYQAMSTGEILPKEDPYAVSTEKVKETGYGMMLEAIYDIFYTSFDWKRLEQDLTESQYIDGASGIDPEVTAANLRALDQLNDYRNYIGRKKPFANVKDKASEKRSKTDQRKLKLIKEFT